MQLLRQWTMVLCVAAITTSILQSVLPEKGSYAVIKLVLGLYILLTLLSPVKEFSAAELQLDFTVSSPQIIEPDVTGAVLQQAQITLEEQLNEALSAAGPPAEQITVLLQLDEEEAVTVQSVAVISKADEASVRKTVEIALGCETNIIVSSPE